MKNLILTISLLLLFNFTVVSQQKISIIPKPENILIEQGENNQLISFDFLVTNNIIEAK